MVVTQPVSRLRGAACVLDQVSSSVRATQVVMYALQVDLAIASVARNQTAGDAQKRGTSLDAPGVG